jgi:hypothetical protein
MILQIVWDGYKIKFQNMIYNLILTFLLLIGLIYAIYKYISLKSKDKYSITDENIEIVKLYERKMYFFAAIIILISLIGRLEKLINIL